MARTPQDGIEFKNLEWTTSDKVWGGTDLDVEPIPVAILSWDAETGASTTLLRLPPGWHTPGPEFHSVVQEDILLEGDISFGGKKFTAPAYFCFPANYVHQQARTENGALMMVTLSGPFDITYPEA